MPDLLLELRSEEIPARMQRKAAGDLKKLLTDGLVEAGLTYEAACEYWTPRRLTLDIRGLTARSKDIREERKGPSVSAPQQAIDGFVRAAGIGSISEAQIQSDPKKGEFYIAVISKPGRAANAIIAELMPKIIREFPWPKSMRSGAASAKPGSLRWVRPLQSIVCMLSTEPEEPVVVEFDVDGIRSGNTTYGHRFHAPEAIIVKRFEDYAAKLERAKVVLDAERRKQIILADARNLCFAQGLELIEDEALLEEVSGLVEWPVVLMGEFEEDYLTIPEEVIRLTIKANQKCFVTRAAFPLAGKVSAGLTDGGGAGSAVPEENSLRPSSESSEFPLPPPSDRSAATSPARGEAGALSNKFILVANIEASDGGHEIAKGNGKVVRARLSDALYFWKTDQADLPDLKDLKDSAAKFGLDLSKPLDQRMARLDHLNVTFHAKLGTQGERVLRIAKLAQELAPLIDSPSPGSLREPSSPRGGEAKASGAAAFRLSPPGRGRPEGPGEGESAALARRAAILCKADLQTEVVGEFPELQGLIGRKYAALQGEHPSVAAAIEDHYKPQGPTDRVPSDPVAIAVALADKLDTLVGFWAIDEKPTGSKDPFALRRAALGVIRIILERGVKLLLDEVIKDPVDEIWGHLVTEDTFRRYDPAIHALYESSLDSDADSLTSSVAENIPSYWDEQGVKERAATSSSLLAFFHDRLKVYLRDQGARHDLIDAVLAGAPSPGSLREPSSPRGGEGEAAALEPLPSPPRGESGSRSKQGEGAPSANDDLLAIARRVEALTAFINTEDGKNLVAGTKRAANILSAEEKKGTIIHNVIDMTIFTDEAEVKLFEAVNQSANAAGHAIERQDYSGAMQALSALREPVDSFFEHVLVNDPDEKVRANRLALLAEIRRATLRVADFSKIAG